MLYLVYIIYSKKKNIFYPGFTKNLHSRITKHNEGLNQFTKNGKPWIVVWKTQKATRSGARDLEKKLKNLSRIRKIKFMQKYSEDLSNPDILELLNLL